MRYFVPFMLILNLFAGEGLDQEAQDEIAGIKYEYFVQMFEQPPFRNYAKQKDGEAQYFSEHFNCVLTKNLVTRVTTSAALSGGSIPIYENQTVKWGEREPLVTSEFLLTHTRGLWLKSSYIVEVFSLPYSDGLPGNATFVVTENQVLRWIGQKEDKAPIFRPVLVLDRALGDERFYRIPVLPKKPSPDGGCERIFGVLRADDSFSKELVFLPRVSENNGAADFTPVPERSKDVPIIGVVRDTKGEFIHVPFPEDVIGQRQRAEVRRKIIESRKTTNPKKD